MRVLVEKDVVFARVGEELLALDIYRPDKEVQPPTVLYLHGGGWAVGDKADGSSERLEQLARNGVAVVVGQLSPDPDGHLSGSNSRRESCRSLATSKGCPKRACSGSTGRLGRIRRCVLSIDGRLDRR